MNLWVSGGRALKLGLFLFAGEEFGKREEAMGKKKTGSFAKIL